MKQPDFDKMIYEIIRFCEKGHNIGILIKRNLR